ncbi:MAG: hypothetical protein M1834_004378 [Cirrosporium novae-zelandiae]|nr:MAG: hypothetical protein M1834_004378 [Cirrosporium novae-zelandiae]
MFFTLPILGALLLPLASAIDITTPTLNSTLSKGSTYNVTWTHVDTDPSVFSIFLVNFVDWPPSYIELADSIPTWEDSYSVYIPCDTATSYGFQFNAINGTNVYVIYAQSDKFFVDGDSCTDPVTTTSAASCPTAASSTNATTTVFVTVSATASASTSPANSTAAATVAAAALDVVSSSSSSSIISTSSPSSSSAALSVSPGIVPKTIGWCSDYSSPVTLSSVPTPAATIIDEGVMKVVVSVSAAATATASAGVDTEVNVVAGATGTAGASGAAEETGSAKTVTKYVTEKAATVTQWVTERVTVARATKTNWATTTIQEDCEA